MVSLSPMHLVLEQANLLDSGVLLACGFSEERLPHQVCLSGFWSSHLPDAEEGRVRGRGRLHLLHLHTLRVLLCLLLKGRCWYRSSPSIWKRNRSGNGYLLVLHPSNECMNEKVRDGVDDCLVYGWVFSLLSDLLICLLPCFCSVTEGISSTFVCVVSD